MIMTPFNIGKVVINGIRSLSQKEKTRQEQWDYVISKLQYWEDRFDGILSFADTLTVLKTDVAVLDTKISMLMAFQGIDDRRKKNIDSNQKRRKSDVKKTTKNRHRTYKVKAKV
jgi:hypothetical protein